MKPSITSALAVPGSVSAPRPAPGILTLMTQPAAGDRAAAARRLYRVMENLIIQAGGGSILDSGPPRGVVTAGDALDAVLQLACIIDWATTEGHIPRGAGEQAAAMLMAVRDYVKPLPPSPLPGQGDSVSADLAEVLRDLRDAGGAAGVQA